MSKKRATNFFSGFLKKRSDSIEELFVMSSNSTIIPDTLYHYYEKAKGPFANLSDLPIENTGQILDQIRLEGKVFASKRNSEYLRVRRELEDKIRRMFIEKVASPYVKGPIILCWGHVAS